MSGGLKGLEDADRKAVQASDVFRAVAGTDVVTIFVVVPVADVMGVLDGPVTAIDSQDLLRTSLLRCLARDPQSGLTRALAGFFRSIRARERTPDRREGSRGRH